MAQADQDKESGDLAELLEETRILLPGSEVLVAFLISVPFAERFHSLTGLQRGVYLATFLAALAALVCFVMPAAYHRLARPIRRRDAFKLLANRFLVAGLVPLSASLVLSAYLVTSLAFNAIFAAITSGFFALLIGLCWWVLPFRRFHDKCDPSSQRSSAPPESGEPCAPPARGVSA